MEKPGLNVIVDAQHSGVHNGHIQAGTHSMIEENGMHGLAHNIIASEGEREVGDASAGLGQGQVLLNPRYGPNEVDGVGGMFLDARCHGEHIDIENDVLGRKTVCRQ